VTKNVVVCCDGTSNEFNSARTNVAKLCFTLVQDVGLQEVYYHPGLGTMAAPGALTKLASWWTKFLGLAIGYGLQSDIRDAYVFLMNHYEPGDRVYIFGFSRGAYTARALTSLLHMYGLLRAGNEALVPYAVRMMLAVNNLPEKRPGRGVSATKQNAADEIWQLAREFKRTFSVACTPPFVGLWDTVNSVGLMSRSFHAPYTANNPDIQVARHALAIDEHRGFFRPSAWYPKDPNNAADPESGPRNLLQVWFPGDHSDVGGGYPEVEAGLSKGALKWMVCEAAQYDLMFDRDRLREMFGVVKSDYIAPDANAPLHNSMMSMGLVWPISEYIPKKRFDPSTKIWKYQTNRFRRREIPDGANVHESAVARNNYVKQCPNFPKSPQIVRTHCDASLGI
jgi:uncharacterized protein (DUF2235 family)